MDLEMAFIHDEEDVMGILEGLVCNMWKKAAECKKELEVLNKKIIVPKLPFKRVAYDEVIKKLNKNGSEITWGEDLGTEEEKLHHKVDVVPKRALRAELRDSVLKEVVSI